MLFRCSLNGTRHITDQKGDTKAEYRVMFAIKPSETTVIKVWVRISNWVSTCFGTEIVFLSANTDLSSHDYSPN